MAIDFTADLAYVLKDASGAEEENVVLGSDRTFGVVDEVDELEHEDAQVRGAVKSVVVKTGSLSALAIDATITVGGTSYTVRDWARLDPDGAETRIWLAE